jgi:serine/threonine-protein kinase HipA
MTIGTYGRTASIYNLISQCERFGLGIEAAREEIERVVTTVRNWRDHFHACGVSAKDIEYIAPAFLPESFFFEKPLEG